MGGKPSSAKATDDPSKLIEIIFSTFNTQIKKDVDTLLTILADIVGADSFSLDNELRLGQMFTSISQHETDVQSQLASYQGKLAGEEDSSFLVSTYTFGERKLVKFISFFMNIEWTLSDIKNSKRPNWKRNVEDIIKKIRAFMLTEGNFTQILNQVQKKTGVLETDVPLSFSPKFKPPEPSKRQKIKELERKLQVVDKQIQNLS